MQYKKQDVGYAGLNWRPHFIIMEIKTMKELVDYISKLVRQGVPIAGITIDEDFYWKINKQLNILEHTTILGLPVCIFRNYKGLQKHDFKIHTRGKE